LVSIYFWELGLERPSRSLVHVRVELPFGSTPPSHTSWSVLLLLTYFQSKEKQ
jgi:hypothetical protein